MSCSDKIEYHTLRGAADAAVADLDRGFVNRPYRCEHCGGYHLTHQPMRGTAALTAAMVRQLAQEVLHV